MLALPYKRRGDTLEGFDEDSDPVEEQVELKVEVHRDAMPGGEVVATAQLVSVFEMQEGQVMALVNNV